MSDNAEDSDLRLNALLPRCRLGGEFRLESEEFFPPPNRGLRYCFVSRPRSYQVLFAPVRHNSNQKLLKTTSEESGVSEEFFPAASE
jgi:hypothetical protein